jgi:hypothetical protein
MKWIIFAIVALGAALYLRFAIRFARNRKAVVKQTGDKWYRYASKEIFSERGQEFLRQHFAETLAPDRIQRESDRPFVQTAALGVYLRLLDENGEDATRFDAVPINREAVARARVLSRIALASALAKDNVQI